MTTGINGRVTLFTGGISESTGLSSLVNSGNFRYNSDEAATNYTKSLGSGIFAVYREQPTIKISPDSKNITYGDTVSGLTYGSSGFVNGDDANILAGTASFNINSTKSTSGHHIFGEHDIAYNSGLTNTLGYSISDDNSTNNELKVAKKVLTISGITAENKTYDGTTDATLVTTNAKFIGMVANDKLNIATSKGTFEDKSVGTNKIVNISNIALGGDDVNNYNLLSTIGSTTADIIAVPIPDPVDPKPDPKPEIKKIVDSITNQTATTVNLPANQTNTTTPNNSGRNTDISFSQGENQMLVSKPIEGQATTRVSLSEARQMQIKNGGSGEEVIVPLSNSSIIQLIDGGVNLPSGVEQEFYLANANTQEEK